MQVGRQRLFYIFLGLAEWEWHVRLRGRRHNVQSVKAQADVVWQGWWRGKRILTRGKRIRFGRCRRRLTKWAARFWSLTKRRTRRGRGGRARPAAERAGWPAGGRW